MSTDDYSPVLHRPWGAIVTVLVLLFIAAGWVIVTDAAKESRAGGDQDDYHLLVVEKLAAEWPHFDFGFTGDSAAPKDQEYLRYRSATTPAYHAVVATAARIISIDRKFIRFAGMIFTVGLIVTFMLALGTRVWAGETMALALPVVCSLYVFSSAAWVLPDNAAWWGVLGVLLLALGAPTPSRLALGGLVMVFLVLTRQVHLWCAGLLWVSAWLGMPPKPHNEKEEEILHERAMDDSPTGKRIVRTALALLCTLPALAAVAYFAFRWRGLVPPLFQGDMFDPLTNRTSPKTNGGNAATPAFIFTLVAMFGPFYLGYVRGAIEELLSRNKKVVRFVMAGFFIGLAAALIPATSFNPDAGRYTGFWIIANKLPTVADRSVFITVMAPLGGALTALWLCGMSRRDMWILLAAFGGFAVASSAAFFAWQRYLEPFVLLWLGLGASRAYLSDAPAPTAPGGPILLAFVQFGITIWSLSRGG